MQLLDPIAAVLGAPTDEDIVRRVRAGDAALFEILMRRHNQRVYRVVRAIVKDEADAEDVMQQAYINAYTHLHQFEERSQFGTWLTRIAMHEAFGRRRQMQRRLAAEPPSADESAPVDRVSTTDADPEQRAYARELQRILEAAVDTLPETYRMVFMLRDVEGLSTNETGEGLGLSDEAVKTRLHRARVMIRRAITARIGEAAAGAFPFHATRCDRVVAAVLARIAEPA